MFYIECWEAERDGDAITHIPVYCSKGFQEEQAARQRVEMPVDPWEGLRLVEVTAQGPRFVMAHSGHRAGEALPRRFHPDLPPVSPALRAGGPEGIDVKAMLIAGARAMVHP